VTTSIDPLTNFASQSFFLSQIDCLRRITSVKSPLSASVVVMAIAGVSAYAITVLLAEANLRTGTMTKTPGEAIGKSLTMIRTDHRFLDEITKRLGVARFWKPGDDQVVEQRSERISRPVSSAAEAF
jgi:hypothetical protein